MSPFEQPTSDAWSEPNQSDVIIPASGQPAGSPIEIRRFDDGFSAVVPPAGLWRGSGGLFGFSLLWNGLMLVFTAAMAGALLGGKPPQDESAWVFPLVVVIFWAVGIGTLLGSIQMGRRHAALAVAGGTLMVMQTGLFGKKQREWLLGDIASIETGPTGVRVNGVPVLELQIRDRSGQKMGMLAGRRVDELEWLAEELRQAVRTQGPVP
jgi:hypothetical protein